MPLRPPWARCSHTDGTDSTDTPRIANAPNSRAEALRSLRPLREIPAVPMTPRTPRPPCEISSALSCCAGASTCRSADGPSASHPRLFQHRDSEPQRHREIAPYALRTPRTPREISPAPSRRAKASAWPSAPPPQRPKSHTEARRTRSLIGNWVLGIGNTIPTRPPTTRRGDDIDDSRTRTSPAARSARHARGGGGRGN